MKIVHILFSFTTGGTETMLVDIMNEQVKTETVSLLIVNDVINEELIRTINPKIHIIRINRTLSGRNPIPLLKINWFLLRTNPDIIHFHNVKGIGLVLPFFRGKTALTIHDTKIQYSFFTKYRKLFAISQSVKQDIFMRYGLETTVIYNGIHTSNITVKQKEKSNAHFRIVQLGRLQHNKKGQDLLIQAIQQLIYHTGRTDIHLDIIGDGPSMSFLKQLVVECNLGDYITFLGNKNRRDIYRHLCDYDLFVQPSIYEGFGLTVTEAMAAKVPVLVSDIEGPMEVIGAGQYGYHFQTENINDLAGKIRSIMDNSNNKNNRQMIEDAYKYVVENFDVKNTAANYLNVYKTL
jgi:glycosyltransferase involved in cell wall biosynthesis